MMPKLFLLFLKLLVPRSLKRKGKDNESI